VASGTRPADGLMEAMPHAFADYGESRDVVTEPERAHAAGERRRLATAGAGRGDLVIPGLRVRPCSVLSVCTRMPSRTIRAGDRNGAGGAEILDQRRVLGRHRVREGGNAHVLGTPFISILHLIVTGTPCSDPRAAPDATALSAASALASASSANTCTIAFSFGFTASMRTK